MLREFIATVYQMAIHGRWNEMNAYFAAIKKIGETVVVTLKAGKPQDAGDHP